MKRASTIPRAAFAAPALVPRQISFVTSCRARVGRVTPCAPRSADSFPNGAHGVTRPTTSRNLIFTVLAGWKIPALLLLRFEELIQQITQRRIGRGLVRTCVGPGVRCARLTTGEQATQALDDSARLAPKRRNGAGNPFDGRAGQGQLVDVRLGFANGASHGHKIR